MNELPNERDSSDTEAKKTDDNSSFRLIASMADTTWRMFVPTIGLLLVGNALDDICGTKPWLMLSSAVVGMLIAALLILRQLRSGA